MFEKSRLTADFSCSIVRRTRPTAFVEAFSVDLETSSNTPPTIRASSLPRVCVCCRHKPTPRNEAAELKKIHVHGRRWETSFLLVYKPNFTAKPWINWGHARPNLPTGCRIRGHVLHNRGLRGSIRNAGVSPVSTSYVFHWRHARHIQGAPRETRGLWISIAQKILYLNVNFIKIKSAI